MAKEKNRTLKEINVAVRELSSALLPCPFCGGSASIEGDRDDGFWMSCDTCYVSAGFQCECDYGDSGEFEQPEDAAKFWNARK